MIMILPLWQVLGVVGLAAAAGCLFGMLAMWHPGRHELSELSDSAARSFNAAIRTGPAELPRAGYLPTANAGCYEPRTNWPEPDWPGTTFSEISAGFDQLERNVIAQTQPFGRITP